MPACSSAVAVDAAKLAAKRVAARCASVAAVIVAVTAAVVIAAASRFVAASRFRPAASRVRRPAASPAPVATPVVAIPAAATPAPRPLAVVVAVLPRWTVVIKTADIRTAVLRLLPLLRPLKTLPRRPPRPNGSFGTQFPILTNVSRWLLPLSRFAIAKFEVHPPPGDGPFFVLCSEPS